MIADFYSALSPTPEQTAGGEASLERAKHSLYDVPEYEGATDRMRNCVHSGPRVVCRELYYECDLAPTFCEWPCRLYDADDCRYLDRECRGCRDGGLRVVDLRCLDPSIRCDRFEEVR